VRNKAIRGLSLLAFLLAVVWVIVAQNFESAITAIVLLVGFLSATWVTSEHLEKENDKRAVRGRPAPGLSGSVGLEGKSLLVLPLRTIQPDGSDDYLADGITEEIIVDLSSIRTLRVISHASALRLRGSDKTPAEIATDLGVGFVLEGSLRREGSVVRVNARIVDVESGNDVWADRFNGELKSVLEIQQEVSAGIVRALALSLDPGREVDATQRFPEDPRALEALLLGRHELWGFSPESLRKAIKHLNNGLSVAGDHEALLATLGQAFCQFAQLGDAESGQYLAKATEVADRIFAINPDSHHGHRLRGWVEFQSGHFRKAGPPLKKALEADPSSPDTALMLGYLLAMSGRMDSANALFDHVVSIDPLTPVSHTLQGAAAVLEGRFQDALPPYQRALELDPDSPFCQWTWSWALTWNQRYEEARDAMEKLVRDHPDSPFAPMAKSLSLGVSGRGQEAVEVLTTLALEEFSSNEMFSREIAHCFAIADRVDEAMIWIERNVQNGNINYPFLKDHDRFLDNLRPDPRFQELLNNVQRQWETFDL